MRENVLEDYSSGLNIKDSFIGLNTKRFFQRVKYQTIILGELNVKRLFERVKCKQKIFHRVKY